MIIGIDIGGTNFRIGAIEDGKVISSLKVKSTAVLKSEDTIKDLADFINAFLDGQKAEAICLGFPSSLDVERKVVLNTPNLNIADNLTIVEDLGKALNTPVFIEKDTYLALFYDVNKYHLSQETLVEGIYFGTGIGSGIFINGQPYLGKNGAAGEMGHIPFNGVTEVCNCGNIGCAENVTGGRYLAKLNVEVLHDDIADVFTNHQDHPLVKEYIDHMAQIIAINLNIMNPDCLIVGGGILAMKDFPLVDLKARIVARTKKPEPANSLNIIFAEDDKDKGIIGAYYCALSRMKD